MERKGAIMSRNIAMSKEAELKAEIMRVKLGLVPAPRTAVINKVYSHLPRGGASR